MKRSQRHHLKQDAVSAAVAQAAQLFASYRREFTAAVVTAVCIGAGTLAYTVWRGWTSVGAQQMLADGLTVLEAPVVPPAPQPGEASETAPTSPPGSYPSESAKLDAALPKLLTVVAHYPSSQAATVALYHAAGALGALGRYEEAERRYQEVIDRDRSGIYGQMAQLGRADVQVQAGKYDSAIAVYQSLTTVPDTPLPVDGVLMQLARAYSRAGRPAEARQAYTRIVEEFPQSLYVADARRALDSMQES